MATNKSTKATTKAEGLAAVEPLAKLLGKLPGELWKIFVMRYVAKGAAEVVIGGAFIWVASLKLWTNHFPYWCIPAVLTAILFFDAIQLLINPRYFAMNDIIERVNAERNSKPGMTIYQK
jgi:hypothetical protein